MHRAIRIFDDLESMSVAAAAAISELAADSTGPFSIALSGGGTPSRLYEILADNFAGIDWSKVHLFWGDERFVPADNPSSNFGSAGEALLNRIDIPDENIHKVPVDSPTAVEAAVDYEKDLMDFFGIRKDRFPVFDLILLGLGADGHTASIFPGDPVIDERERWTAAVTAPAGIEPSERITLTLPVLNASKNIFFLVSGDSKSDALHEILFADRSASVGLPAVMVRPDGPLVWFIDRQAYGAAPELEKS